MNSLQNQTSQDRLETAYGPLRPSLEEASRVVLPDLSSKAQPDFLQSADASGDLEISEEAGLPASIADSSIDPSEQVDSPEPARQHVEYRQIQQFQVRVYLMVAFIFWLGLAGVMAVERTKSIKDFQEDPYFLHVLGACGYLLCCKLAGMAFESKLIRKLSCLLFVGTVASKAQLFMTIGILSSYKVPITLQAPVALSFLVLAGIVNCSPRLSKMKVGLMLVGSTSAVLACLSLAFRFNSNIHFWCVIWGVSVPVVGYTLDQEEYLTEAEQQALSHSDFITGAIILYFRYTRLFLKLPRKLLVCS